MDYYAGCFQGENLNLGAVFVTDINHISLISFAMKQQYKNIPISTNNNNSFESMRLLKLVGIGTYSLRSRSSINFFAIDVSILRVIS